MMLVFVTVLALTFVLVALVVMVVREKRLRGVDGRASGVGGEDGLLRGTVEDVTFLDCEFGVAVPLCRVQDE